LQGILRFYQKNIQTRKGKVDKLESFEKLLVFERPCSADKKTNYRLGGNENYTKQRSSIYHIKIPQSSTVTKTEQSIQMT
jgi:hypothetical protein